MKEIDTSLKNLKILAIFLFFILVGGIILLIILLINKSSVNEINQVVKSNIECMGGKLEFTGQLEDFIQDKNKLIFFLETKNGKNIKIVDYCNNKVISEIDIKNE